MLLRVSASLPSWFPEHLPGPLLLALGIGLVTLVALVALRALFGVGRRFPYERCPALFTPAERAFLLALRRAAGSDFVVFGKVRLADIIRPGGPLSRQRYFQALGRVTSKHIDFALCDPRTFQIVVAIELDDRTHQTDRRRRERDVFVEGALAAAGVPLLRVPVQRGYDAGELRQRINTLAQRPATVSTSR